MEIIYHTADINKNMMTLETILSSGIPTIELDFVITRDGIPVWTHNLLPTSLLSSKSTDEKHQLTLFDVLDINKHRCKLMLDFKYIPKNILNSQKFTKLLESLNKYGELQIQSLDLSLLKKLKENNYSNIETGLIINVLTKWYIDNIKLPDIDFMSISSELWEQKNGEFVEKCKSLYSNVKKYAWTWSTRIEDEYRIDNFINKKADGIITSDPAYVKTLTNRNIKKN